MWLLYPNCELVSFREILSPIVRDCWPLCVSKVIVVSWFVFEAGWVEGRAMVVGKGRRQAMREGGRGKEGGREGRKEGRKEGGREGGRERERRERRKEGRKEGGREKEGGKEGGRERGRKEREGGSGKAKEQGT